MPSKRTDERFAWLRRAAGWMAALVLVAIGWTHGVIFVEGGSMEPTLSAGDVLVYRRHQTGVETGDLVLFEHRGALVVHRVVSTLRGGRLRTRGDANDSLDVTPVEPGAITGEVVAVVPSGALAERLAAWRE